LKLDNLNEDLPEILILEDDSIIALLQKYMLEKMTEIKPLLFGNGQDAIQYLDERADKAAEVLVLLDINMPVMNGWEFMDSFKTRNYGSKVHVAMVTSSLFKQDYEKAKQYEQIIGYYTKPLKQRDLREILKKDKVAHLFTLPVKE